MKKEKLKQIVDRLNASVPGGFECPICHKRSFRVVNGFFQSIVQDDPLALSLDGHSVPSIQIICQNCGFMSNHSIGVLDHELIDNSEEPKNDESGISQT